MSRRAAGTLWEDRAASHLCDHGLEPVARNFHSRFGEIDLIMCDDATLVFIEVRYRSARARVGAAASVNPGKQHRLIQAAQFFLLRQPQWAQARMRFDVVAFDASEDGSTTIAWHRDAFRAG
ncbi:MAG: YraN family protein [Pseudomonadota bacterium]